MKYNKYFNAVAALIIAVALCGCAGTPVTENTASREYVTSSKAENVSCPVVSETVSEPDTASETVSEMNSESVQSRLQVSEDHGTQSSESESVTSTVPNELSHQQSRVVYRTPTGKRYHFDPECGGKNSTATTLDAAVDSGLTPCKKCANG